MVQAGLASADADCLYVRLYVDGALKGQMVQGVSYVNDAGNDAQITGGKPADLSGPIRLCSRSDDNATRHFGGRVAYLGVLSALYSPARLKSALTLSKHIIPAHDSCFSLHVQSSFSCLGI